MNHFENYETINDISEYLMLDCKRYDGYEKAGADDEG
nr:MAG TPA: hypothetical protein [Caudoviricetes sp.]